MGDRGILRSTIACDFREIIFIVISDYQIPSHKAIFTDIAGTEKLYAAIYQIYVALAHAIDPWGTKFMLIVMSFSFKTVNLLRDAPGNNLLPWILLILGGDITPKMVVTRIPPMAIRANKIRCKCGGPVVPVR